METPTFRSRILDAEDGYSPRLQLELLLRSGIGSILSKPQWWLKWRSVLPAKRSGDEANATQTIADKWLDEIVTAVLENRFYWMTKHRQSWHIYALDAYKQVLLRRLVGYPEDDSEGREEKLRAFLQQAQTTVAFQLAFDHDVWPEGAFETLEMPETTTEDDVARRLRHELETCRFFDSEEFQEQFKELDSMSVLSWYFSVLALSRRAKDQENGEWPETEDLPYADEDVRKRAIDLIKAAHRGDVTKESFLSQYPDADPRAKAVELVWFHVERASSQVESIRECVRATLDDVITQNDLMNSSSSKGFISPGPVMETWIRDSIVAPDVKAKFVDEVATLENVPEEAKDWHPGSNNQVLDLVHPSLYCCVLGETLQVPESDQEDTDLTPADRMNRIIFSSTEATESASDESSYQWIPSDFDIDDEGNVKIKSYINNLHPVHHQEMYQSIEHIFSGFVPMFDRVLSWLANEDEPEPSFEDDGCDRDNYYHNAPMFPEIPAKLDLEGESPTPYSVKGTTLQVITKIAEIHLTPENPTYPGGAWHIEGTETENIVATGIYYFGSENITESKLSFRVVVKAPEYAQSDYMGVATTYGLENENALMQSLGAATAIEDRCIVFPNTFQHKVEPFELADPSRPGVRKILAFFVVDPSQKILSTSVIPPQQADWLKEAQLEALRGVDRLPEAVAESTLSEMLARGMSLEQAKEHRERLMGERGPFNFDEYEEELTFSLCEH
ncbi:hypothetical protein ATCC90586_000785 [Pythium insidiosum]|nr:hypothetical protein ATCC90586_000785 [Pythium insidiosum]